MTPMEAIKDIESALMNESAPLPADDDIDIFVESEGWTFDGQKLNTSAYRSVFVEKTKLALYDQDNPEGFYPGFAEDALKVVFACLQTDEKLAEYSMDLKKFVLDLNAWATENELLATSDKLGEVAKTAWGILASWQPVNHVADTAGKAEAQG